VTCACGVGVCVGIEQRCSVHFRKSGVFGGEVSVVSMSSFFEVLGRWWESHVNYDDGPRYVAKVGRRGSVTNSVAGFNCK
jgi:hypothetical protein